jgi:hypothetical protein
MLTEYTRLVIRVLRELRHHHAPVPEPSFGLVPLVGRPERGVVARGKVVAVGQAAVGLGEAVAAKG